MKSNNNALPKIKGLYKCLKTSDIFKCDNILCVRTPNGERYAHMRNEDTRETRQFDLNRYDFWGEYAEVEPTPELIEIGKRYKSKMYPFCVEVTRIASDAIGTLIITACRRVYDYEEFFELFETSKEERKIKVTLEVTDQQLEKIESIIGE